MELLWIDKNQKNFAVKATVALPIGRFIKFCRA